MRSSTISNRSALICLSVFASLAAASGQTPAPKPPLRTEPLEKYDMPPAYIYRLETSPRMISQYGPLVSYQGNVDANHQDILGDAANELSNAVYPAYNNTMAFGWRQFNLVN